MAGKKNRKTFGTLRRHIFNAGGLERFVSEIKKERRDGFSFMNPSSLTQQSYDLEHEQLKHKSFILTGFRIVSLLSVLPSGV